MSTEAQEAVPGLSRYLYEFARDIILVMDATTGAIVAANRAAELAYQLTQAELCTRTIFELRVEAEGTINRQMAEANSDGILFETVHRRADGSTFPVEVSSRGDAPATGEPQRYLFSIIRDISERKRLEAERAQLLATTQHALALRDEFLLVASHELRTPVANVGLQLQSLRRVLDRDPSSMDRIRAGSDAAIRELARLATLIESLLLAQHDRDLALHVTVVDVGELVQEVVGRLRAFADQLGAQVAVEAPSGLVVRGDRMRLDQVVANLLTNALKYGARHPIEIRTYAGEGGRVVLDVCDHGIGISRADAARIFDKFERAVPSGNYSGFGLGLYIARRICEAHAGTIELVDSQPARGSTFRVSLPPAE